RRYDAPCSTVRALAATIGAWRVGLRSTLEVRSTGSEATAWSTPTLVTRCTGSEATAWSTSTLVTRCTGSEATAWSTSTPATRSTACASRKQRHLAAERRVSRDYGSDGDFRCRNGA